METGNGKLHKLEVKMSRRGVRSSLPRELSGHASSQTQPAGAAADGRGDCLFATRITLACITMWRLKPGPATDPHFVLHVPADEVQWSSREGKMLAMLAESGLSRNVPLETM